MTVNPEDPKEEKEEKKEEEGSENNKLLDTLKKNKNIESLICYAKAHTQDTIAYVIMTIGIIWMFFQSFYGGVLVGLITGYYFSKEVVQLIKSFNECVEEQGIPRSLIIGGTLFALFIMAPGIFIGAAIMIGIMMMLKQV